MPVSWTASGTTSFVPLSTELRSCKRKLTAIFSVGGEGASVPTLRHQRFKAFFFDFFFQLEMAVFLTTDPTQAIAK